MEKYIIEIILFSFSLILSIFLFIFKRKSILYTTLVFVLFISIIILFANIVSDYLTDSWAKYLFLGGISLFGILGVFYQLSFLSMSSITKRSSSNIIIKKLFYNYVYEEQIKKSNNVNKSIDELNHLKNEYNDKLVKLTSIIEKSKALINIVDKQLIDIISFIEKTMASSSNIDASKIDDSKIDDSKIDDSKIDDSKIDDSKIDDSKIDKTPSLFLKSLEAMYLLDKSIEKTITEMKHQSETLVLTFEAFDITTMSMQKLDDITKEASQLAYILSTNARDGSGALNLMDSAIEEIANSSLTMEEFIVTINNISEKTSLLAMNAAIEAAHAGVKGKGFAIVASEVRKLATNTSVATAEVKKGIKRILDKIQNAVTLVNNTKVIFKNILENIERTNLLNREVYDISKNNTIQGREIVTAVNQLKSITQRIIEASADELFQTSEVIISMNEIHSVSKLIVRDIKNLYGDIDTGTNKIEKEYQRLIKKDPLVYSPKEKVN